MWLVITFVSWLSFQLWWNRREKLSIGSERDEFVASPVFAHFIKTLGEWWGLWIAVVGCAFALFTTIFFGSNGASGLISSQMGMGFLKPGIQNIILLPVYVFLVLVLFRFLAEQFKAITTIANNTKKSDPKQPG